MKIIKAPKFKTVKCECGCEYEFEQGDKTRLKVRNILTDENSIILGGCDFTSKKEMKIGSEKRTLVELTLIEIKCPICGRLNVLHYCDETDV